MEMTMTKGPADTGSKAPANTGDQGSSSKTKMDSSVKQPDAQMSKPYTTSWNGQTITQGDSAKAIELAAKARQTGEITVDGQKVKIDSAQGKGELAKLKSIGQGDTLDGAKTIGKLEASRAANIARGQAVLKNKQGTNSNKPASVNRGPSAIRN
jgi:hypothetical protein